MCGIYALLHKRKLQQLDYSFYPFFQNLKVRGPDRTILYDLSNPVNIKLGFHRLAIMDTSSMGDQPFVYTNGDNTVYVICNGEIYNYKELIENHKLDSKSGSDCEVIMLLYQKYNNIDLIVNLLMGEYAFLICDVNNITGDYTIYCVNDRFGIRPLFVYEDEDNIIFTSVINGISLKNSINYKIERFEPRHYAVYTKKNDIVAKTNYVKYYDFNNIKQTIYDLNEAKNAIRNSLEYVVNLMGFSDRPVGCLLSGGLDSSLVASILSRSLKLKGKKLRTFSIGLPDSTDEYYAKLVSKHIDSEHIHILVSEEDFLNAIPQVVKITETYDITTIRASTPQYLLSKWISENTNIKVLFCGDGSDEYGGYLYFHNAPSINDFKLEAIRLLNDIHLYDGLRADRCIASNGIEARFPFLNHHFAETYLTIDTKLRMPNMGIEKWLLREAFKDDDYLPHSVLYRKKEGFSDGCSSVKKSWYQILQDSLENIYNDNDLELAKHKYPHLTPYTKESLYIRDLFCDYFGNGDVNKIYKYYWLPKWCGDIKDPSARKLDFYN